MIGLSIVGLHIRDLIANRESLTFDEIKSHIFKRFVQFFQCHEDDTRIL
ncbi:MAG: hypothetical protein ACFFDK_17495 [Promethearchaeota archaeon]